MWTDIHFIPTMSRIEAERVLMKAVVVLILLIAATSGAFYVAWMNRSSEKIVSAVIPISIAALVGIFMAVFVFGGTSPIYAEFPVMFFFEVPSNSPISLPFRPVLPALFLMPELVKREPDVLKDSDRATTLYHHLLQRALIDNLVLRYRAAWRVNISRFETGLGYEMMAQPLEGARELAQIITGQQLEAALAGNRFGSFSSPSFYQLTVPLGTKLNLVPPHLNNGLEESSIILENGFVRLTIRTQRNSWGVLHGEYRLMLGQPSDTNTNLRQITFVVSTKTEFKRLRSGHPDMPKYKVWAQQIVYEIQNELDEQTIWRHTKDQYLFARQLPPGANINFSILRFAVPQGADQGFAPDLTHSTKPSN